MRWTFLLSLVLLAPLAHAQAPAPGDIVINEILYDPPTPQPSANEWIEVVNRSDQSVDLAGLTVSDGGSTSEPVAGPLVLEPGEFAVLVRDGEAFTAAFPGVEFVELDGFPTLNNTGDRLAILLGTTEIDVVPYESSWGGSDASLERRDPDGPSTQAANFGATTDPDGGTPGEANTLFAPDTQPPDLLAAEAEDATTVRATFDEPLDPTTGLDAARYQISDGIGTPTSAAFGDDATEVVLTLATPLTSPASYTLTVTGVEDPSGNALASDQAAFFFGQGDAAAPRDLVINEFLYDEPSSDNPGEFVELFNRTDQTFDLRDFTLNDGAGDDEPITSQAVFVGPGEYAVVVEDGALFSAVFPDVPFVEQVRWSALNNGGDAIVLKSQGTVIDSLFYQPSWGGEDASLERRDPDGPSSVASNYATTSDPRGGTPGAQNSQFAPDVTGPTLVSAAPSPDGRTVLVTVDEPLDSATATPGAFSISGGPAVQSVSYTPETTTMTLTLASAFPSGESTITASGLADLLGNVTAQSSTTVTFVPDVTSPTLARAMALSPTTLRARFSEPVTQASATDAAAYSITGFSGTVASVTVDETDDGGVTSVVLTVSAPFADQTVNTLVATNLQDLAGNVTAASSVAFFVGTPDVPGAGDLVITEIMYDPQTGSDGEYLEVLNTTADRIFDLRSVTLDDGDADGDALADEPVLVLPGQYLALARELDGFRVAFPEADAIEAGTVISLSNSGEAIVLRAGGAVLDSVFYDPGWHRVELDDATGIALERRDPAGPSNAASNWSSSLADLGGTPSAENSLSISGTPVERDGGVTVTSPFAPTRGEAAEITYTLSTEAALVRARIFDGGGREVRELEPGRLSGATATLTWDGTGDDRQPLRAGIYVVLVEAVDAQGGTTEAHTAALVLARPE